MSGGPCTTKKLAIRLVVGAWCLAAFVLGQAYNSTFVTYVIAPIAQPLINSVHDIVNDPNIRVIVEKGRGMDVFFSVISKIIVLFGMTFCFVQQLTALFWIHLVFFF